MPSTQYKMTMLLRCNGNLKDLDSDPSQWPLAFLWSMPLYFQWSGGNYINVLNNVDMNNFFSFNFLPRLK